MNTFNKKYLKLILEAAEENEENEDQEMSQENDFQDLDADTEANESKKDTPKINPEEAKKLYIEATLKARSFITLTVMKLGEMIDEIGRWHANVEDKTESTASMYANIRGIPELLAKQPEDSKLSKEEYARKAIGGDLKAIGRLLEIIYIIPRGSRGAYRTITMIEEPTKRNMPQGVSALEGIKQVREEMAMVMASIRKHNETEYNKLINIFKETVKRNDALSFEAPMDSEQFKQGSVSFHDAFTSKTLITWFERYLSGMTTEDIGTNLVRTPSRIYGSDNKISSSSNQIDDITSDSRGSKFNTLKTKFERIEEKKKKAKITNKRGRKTDQRILDYNMSIVYSTTVKDMENRKEALKLEQEFEDVNNELEIRKIDSTLKSHNEVKDNSDKAYNHYARASQKISSRPTPEVDYKIGSEILFEFDYDLQHATITDIDVPNDKVTVKFKRTVWTTDDTKKEKTEQVDIKLDDVILKETGISSQIPARIQGAIPYRHYKEKANVKVSLDGIIYDVKVKKINIEKNTVKVRLQNNDEMTVGLDNVIPEYKEGNIYIPGDIVKVTKDLPDIENAEDLKGKWIIAKIHDADIERKAYIHTDSYGEKIYGMQKYGSGIKWEEFKNYDEPKTKKTVIDLRPGAMVKVIGTQSASPSKIGKVKSITADIVTVEIEKEDGKIDTIKTNKKMVMVLNPKTLNAKKPKKYEMPEATPQQEIEPKIGDVIRDEYGEHQMTFKGSRFTREKSFWQNRLEHVSTIKTKDLIVKFSGNNVIVSTDTGNKSIAWNRINYKETTKNNDAEFKKIFKVDAKALGFDEPIQENFETFGFELLL